MPFQTVIVTDYLITAISFTATIYLCYLTVLAGNL